MGERARGDVSRLVGRMRAEISTVPPCAAARRDRLSCSVNDIVSVRQGCCGVGVRGSRIACVASMPHKGNSASLL